MKRILSMLLALTLIISLVPAVFAADAEEGIISYVIKTTSISTEEITAEHPVNLVTEGENAGKLNVSDGKGGYFANTYYNLLYQFNSASSVKDGNLANSEVSMMSYRDIPYYAIKNATTGSVIPVRKYSDSTSGLYTEGGAVKEYTLPCSLDLSKTAPFEFFGRSSKSSHGFLYSNGYRAAFTVGTTTAGISAYMDAANTIPEDFSFAVRIKIPDDAVSGKYTIDIANAIPTYSGIYVDENAATADVYVTKIDPETGFEGLFKNSTGCPIDFVDKNGNALNRSAYADDANKLTGTYCANGAKTVSFEDVKYFKAGEEYIVYFELKKSGVSENTVVANSTTYYQNFRISQIDLIPVTEDVPPALASAELAYDEATKTASVTSAKMNDGTAATGYTVTYGINSAKGATISSTGVITPGTDDETVSVYADVTLDGKTVRATFSDIKLLGKEPGQLKYRISSDFINDAAYETIINLTAPTYAISNAETTFISWKDMYYTKSDSTLARATAETTDLAPITNILSPDTDKYELPGRHSADNVPRLESAGFISQFRAQGYDVEEKETTNAYEHQYKTGRPHYAIKLYIPQKGAYELSLKNNFTPAIGADFVAPGFFTKNGNNYTSLEREVVTEVYFAKADYDLNYKNGQGILSGTGAEAYLVDDNKIGWYNSGLYGETQNYDGKYLVAPEAGEYFIIFTATSDSLEKNPNVYHREHTDKEGATTGYQDYQLFVLSEIELTPVAEDAEYEEAFDAVVDDDFITSGTGTVNAYTYTDKEESLSLNNTVELGQSVEVTAPEKDGYSFLYWAKGAIDKKQVISYNKKLTYKPAEGANYVVAVYEKDGSETNKAEFYNANGSLIETLTADGKTPELPSMAGFGVASGWQLYGSEEVFAAEADVAVSGNMIFVAKYDEKPGKVEVNGVEYTYGETVTMPTLDDSKIFKGWKRNGELVSTDKDYTFKAWENATVEAVYAESPIAYSGKFMKIIIDAFEAGNDTAVMAEFIGFGNDVVEKGIMVGNKKVAMKSGDNQFSLLADVDGEYIGYAILRDGTSFIEVTDGKINIAE